MVENVFGKKMKKPGLPDHSMVTGGPGQKPDFKKCPGLSDSDMIADGLILYFSLTTLICCCGAIFVI